MKLTEKHFVISRLWRNGKVTIPTSETILKEKDHLLIISVKADVESIKVLFGEQETTDWNKEDIDWNAIDSQLISRRIVVTRQPGKRGKARLAPAPQPIRDQHHPGKPCGYRSGGLP